MLVTGHSLAILSESPRALKDSEELLKAAEEDQLASGHSIQGVKEFPGSASQALVG
jgi:hypothetical protein